MIVQRIFGFKSLVLRTWFHLTYLSLYATIAYFLYVHFDLTFLAIPWLPVSLIGIAVSFYVGFKNNSAYDRSWEARKIWGAIVNSSRAFGSNVRHFITPLFSKADHSDSELQLWHKKLIYRHITWLYQLRLQLLKPQEWEHLYGNWGVRKFAESRRKRTLEMFPIPEIEKIHEEYLEESDRQRLKSSPNHATTLLDSQSKDFRDLREMDLLDDFRHMVIQRRITEFYEQQGKLERIKNFPLPRTYASVSYYFVALFVVLLPFGLLPEFVKLGPGYNWIMIPFSALVSWVFILMELVGDYTENPFEGMAGDIPMLSITRTIERDLLAMLESKELPPIIESKNNILM